MSDDKNTKENMNEEVKVEKTEASSTTPEVKAEAKVETQPKAAEATPAAAKPATPSHARPKREFKKNKRTSKRRSPKVRSEFDQKIIDIRRVTRVSSGGRRFTFSVSLVVGNRKGKIGVGIGKAGDTALAIEKAAKDAKRNAIIVKTTKSMSIPHEVDAKFNSALVKIMPAKGRGIIAGSALRDIIELGGLKDINGKIISGSKNKLNIAKATVKAFQSLEKTVKGDLHKEVKKEAVIKTADKK